MAKNNFFKKIGEFGGISLPDLKNYYNATVLKTVWYWYVDKHVKLMEQNKSPKVNPQIYGQLVFDKYSKAIQ